MHKKSDLLFIVIEETPSTGDNNSRRLHPIVEGGGGDSLIIGSMTEAPHDPRVMETLFHPSFSLFFVNVLAE